MNETTNQDGSEIDLSEILSIVWSHKTLVAFVTGLFVFISGYYSLTTDKRFTATAIFKIEANSSNGLNIPSDLGALASVVGFGSNKGTDTEILIERIMQREFILTASKTLSLERDPFFQTYNSNVVDPFWKATIKDLIGWQKTSQSEELLIEATIQANFSEYVVVSPTKAGGIKISVIHKDPNLAAQYANEIMELVRQTIKAEDQKSKEIRYPIGSDACQFFEDMEVAQENIKKYTLENSVTQENFIVESLQLDNLRQERQEAGEFLSLLQTLQEMVELGNSTQALMRL